MTTNEFHEALISSCRDTGIMLTKEQVLQFVLYKDILLDWNARMNLTAITEPLEMAVKHFSDSLALLSYFPIPSSSYVLDIGSGAGFPGIPLKIVQPDIHLTLLDRLNKRIQFLCALLSGLSISADTIHGRAEELARKSDFRENYDLVTARAVSALPALCEYCLPFVQVGGHFLALKGPTIDNELREAERAIQILGGTIVELHSYILSDQSKRSLLVVRKTSPSPHKYPRQNTKIVKNPL